MVDRQVKKTGKDGQGDITKLCNDGAAWSPRLKRDAIDDIEKGAHTYFVSGSGGARTEIVVVKGPTGKFLRTDPDKTTKNNLGELPDC